MPTLIDSSVRPTPRRLMTSCACAQKPPASQRLGSRSRAWSSACSTLVGSAQSGGSGKCERSGADCARAQAPHSNAGESETQLSDSFQGELFRICDQHHLPRESERREWPRLCALLTEAQYNSCIIEDKNSNGMVEALILWQSIINSPCEHHSSCCPKRS